MGSTIDLHIHTNASDGTDSPENLLWEIQKAGIKIFAITDHDTIKGAMKMKKILPAGMRFIQGIEFSCRTQGGHKCHILGLNYDENNLDFQAALRAGRIRQAVLGSRGKAVGAGRSGGSAQAYGQGGDSGTRQQVVLHVGD